MFPRKRLLALKSSPILMALLLAGCGGGGSGGDGDSSSDNATAKSTSSPDLLPGRYYTEIDYDNGDTAVAATFLSSTGKFVTAVDSPDITVGKLAFGSEKSISGSGTNVFYTSSWETVSGSIAGTIESTGTARLKATAPGFESTVFLEREEIFSDLGVTLAAVSGIYTMSVAGSTTTITIAADGTITGNDNSGCVYNGNLTIPDTSFNVFEVSFNAANCGGDDGELRNGDYTGLGVFTPVVGEVEFLGSDGEVAAAFVGRR